MYFTMNVFSDLSKTQLCNLMSAFFFFFKVSLKRVSLGLEN